jgi:acyl-CoA thioester hydrolase
MGYVYYGNYAMYYEVARVEALRQMGFAYKSLEDLGVMMPVVDLKCRYKQPGFYDELLTIKVTIPEMPAVKMKFMYEITNEKEEVINLGETTLFFADMETGKPTRIPAIMKELFQPFFQ